MMVSKSTYGESEVQAKGARGSLSDRTTGHKHSEAPVSVRKVVGLTAGVVTLFGLYLSSSYSYILFHSLAELFSIVIGCGIFIIAWNSRRILDNNYLLFLGIAYLFISGIDLLHTLAYKGMGVFPGYDADLPTQLWISARYIEAFSLLLAPLFLGRKLNATLGFCGYVLATSLLLISIFYWDIFPACFIEGIGLTRFKRVSEYCISLALLGAISVLIRKRHEFDGGVLRLLVASIALTIASELAFTFYIHVYGLSNLIGHYFKIISFYLMYKAIVETGLSRPYALLFRDLKRSEAALQKANVELEERVQERTAELWRLSSQLLIAQEEERKRIALELHDGIGQNLSAIKYRVEGVLGENDWPTAADRATTLNPVISAVREAVEEVRRISMNLRPSILDDLGILATISWLCREMESTYSRIRIEKQINVQESQVPDPLKIVIYRILQEALNNMAKYSQANLVHLSLEVSDGSLELTVKDNGVGFDVAQVRSSSQFRRGLGLASMKERTDLSGGAFSIESKKGQGTTVHVSWPVAGNP
jgi:signal transduction histidine kinase